MVEYITIYIIKGGDNMSCSSCGYLETSKKKNGGSSGCIYYCSKNKCYVNGCNNSCNNYKSSYRPNYECNRIYNEGKSYCDDTAPISFYLVILIGLVLLGLILKLF